MALTETSEEQVPTDAEERPCVGRPVKEGHRELNVRLSLFPARRANFLQMREKQVSMCLFFFYL